LAITPPLANYGERSQQSAAQRDRPGWNQPTRIRWSAHDDRPWRTRFVVPCSGAGSRAAPAAPL